MKSFKLLFVAMLIGLSTVTYAGNELGKEPTAKSVSTFVQQELTDDCDEYFDGDESKVYIEFMVNKNNEFIVLSTSAEDRAFDLFIKSRLNYKSFQSASIEVGKTYNIKVNFQKKFKA